MQNDSVVSANPGKVAEQQTSLLYAGEQFDTSAQQYYLRARYYNPLNGRFNSADPFGGRQEEPQSLHKYNYTANNPVNQLDPSGLDWFFAQLGVDVQNAIQAMYRIERPGAWFGRGIPGTAGVLKPDIMNFSLKEIGEIKPLSQYGLATGPIQLFTYLYVANALGVPGAIDKPWTGSSWNVGVRLVPLPPKPQYDNIAVVTIGNAYGLIFYKAFRLPDNRSKMMLPAAFLAILAQQLKSVVEQINAAAKERAEGELEHSIPVWDGMAEYAWAISQSHYQARQVSQMVMVMAAGTLAIAGLLSLRYSMARI